jgi:beta-lactamase regulating signal transducer with metallopeptidase domain
VIDWLFTNALAALALAAIAGVLIWTFRPSPAVRHALWLIVVIKLVSPTGLVVSVPLPVEQPKPASTEIVDPPDPLVSEEIITIVVTPRPGETLEHAAAMTLREQSAAPANSQANEESVALPSAAAASRRIDYRLDLLLVWSLGALFVAYRQLRETIRFARFARRGLPATESLVAEVTLVANRLRVRVPAVRVLPGLTSPLMWCLWRPILLWPAGLECRLTAEGRRAVLAHELAHLRRRDHWVRRLEMIAAVLHWWNPLFWIARKKLRNDAELACDAWATGQADRRSYAEALLEVCSFNPRRRPAPAVGVIGEGRRAMQERLTMIMRDRVPTRLAFGAKLIVALMAIAAVPAWTLGQSAPVTETPPANNPTDAQVKELEAQIKALAQKLEAVKAAKRAEAETKAVESAAKAREVLGERLKEVHLRLQREGVAKVAEPHAKVMIAGKDGVKVIGPDGKELKDVKVIIVEGKQIEAAPALPALPFGTKPPVMLPGGQRVEVVGDKVAAEHLLKSVYAVSPRTATDAITLSRATYKLSKEQAAALATLLGAVKATVMETKVDGDSITVTTTPETQATIGQIVRLMQGQSGVSDVHWRIVAPPAPAVPARPAKPVPPAAPPMPKLPNIEFKFNELKLDPAMLEQLKEMQKLEFKIDSVQLKDLEKLKELDKSLKFESNLEKLKDLEKALKIVIPAQNVKPGNEKKPETEKKPTEK